MKKPKKEEIQFLKYQEHCYNTLNNLLDDGWYKYKFNMPPEFILSLIFINSILRHPSLMQDGKQAWLTSYKKICKELPDDVDEAIKKLLPEQADETNKIYKDKIIN